MTFPEMLPYSLLIVAVETYQSDGEEMLKSP
jgi:hypothetical protein